ncbi:hypothetical protein [Bacillus sp. PF5]|uniref:hypothetical protein n=1 Tax=Bacillus sp. PF5 TaxID=2249214 RepID=UPI000DF83657|nr:hypothetical protein [Bacillus sp. PF5]
MNKRVSFLGLGLFFSLSTLLFYFVIFMAGDFEFPLPSLTTLSLAILCFSIWYVFPDIQVNDERAQFVKKQAIFSTFFATLFYVVIFTLIVNFTDFSFGIKEILQVLIALIIVTSSLMLVITNKRN